MIQAPVICEPGRASYSVSSHTKAGKVTAWGKHVKNDKTSETFTWTTGSTATYTASMSVSGNFSANAGIAKLAEVSLGGSVQYGKVKEKATTSSYSRQVTFNKPGKWIIWSGVYTGSGNVKRSECNANGTALKVTGNGAGKTFKKARVTGLTNCANSVSDAVERNAKAKC
ncbi:hypothetical protein ACFVDU_21675 [Streptomyces albidoflavus]